MANLNMVLTEALRMRREISQLFRKTGYNETGDVSGLDIDYKDAEQLFLLDELRGILDKPSDVEDKPAYLTLPVAETSRL